MNTNCNFKWPKNILVLELGKKSSALEYYRRPLDFHWRPQAYYQRPHIFIKNFHYGDPDLFIGADWLKSGISFADFYPDSLEQEQSLEKIKSGNCKPFHFEDFLMLEFCFRELSLAIDPSIFWTNQFSSFNVYWIQTK